MEGQGLETTPSQADQPPVVHSPLGQTSSAPAPPQGAPASLPSPSINPPSWGGGSLGTGTLQPTAQLVLHAEEAARASAFGRTLAIIAASALCFMPFMGGEAWLRAAMCVAVLAIGLTATWVMVGAREEARYTTGMFRVFGMTCAIGSIAIDYYLGVFSPTPLVITLGIAFFGLGADRPVALLAPLTAIGGYLGLVLLIVLGVIEDRGQFPADNVPIVARVFVVVLVPVVLLVTLWQARASRRATLDAIEQSNKAVKVARLREAELHEANQNLDLALRIGAGNASRYTGMQVGRYRLAEVVGRGGMGEIYAATDFETGDPAAVKMMNASALDHPELVRRFLREAELTRRIRVPNVVEVHEVGESADGAPYIAMELLSGLDLAAHLRRRRKLTLTEVVDLAEQVARGLDAAHAAGVIHRDLKPQNLFLAEQAGSRGLTWKILDFGVSKLRGAQITLTHHDVVGTPSYMAPEQAQGLEPDPRSDIFALGAVLYRSLTGRLPFPGNDMVEIVYSLLLQTPPRPSEICTGLPTDVDHVLAIATAKQAEDRFATATELAHALLAAAKGDLDPAIRERAIQLQRTQPWGDNGRSKQRPAGLMQRPS